MGVAENRTVVVDAYKKFGEGDLASIVAMNSPAAVWAIYSSTYSPMTGEHTGLDGINDLFEMIGEQLEVISFEMAPIAAEGDVVVAAGRQDYTVKTTGKKVQGPLVHVFTFGPDGKIVRFEEFETGAEGAFS